MKQLFRSLALATGFEIRRIGGGPRPGIAAFLASREVDLVLDVGANIGQFAMEIRGAGYTGEIVSFEPIGAVFEALKRHAALDRKWHVHNLALGEAPGEASINVSHATVYSSILPLTAAGAAFDARAQYVGGEIVEMARLDDIASGFAGRTMFLKIDVQGFEKQVLAGARETLRKIKGVQLEISLEPLYSGSWPASEAIAFMEAVGFVIAQMEIVNHRRKDPVSALEIDCLFRRQEADQGAEL
jgi:FkbM family methyltransferase